MASRSEWEASLHSRLSAASMPQRARQIIDNIMAEPFSSSSVHASNVHHEVTDATSIYGLTEDPLPRLVAMDIAQKYVNALCREHPSHTEQYRPMLQYRLSVFDRSLRTVEEEAHEVDPAQAYDRMLQPKLALLRGLMGPLEDSGGNSDSTVYNVLEQVRKKYKAVFLEKILEVISAGMTERAPHGQFSLPSPKFDPSAQQDSEDGDVDLFFAKLRTRLNQSADLSEDEENVTVPTDSAEDLESLKHDILRLGEDDDPISSKGSTIQPTSARHHRDRAVQVSDHLADELSGVGDLRLEIEDLRHQLGIVDERATNLDRELMSTKRRLEESKENEQDLKDEIDRLTKLLVAQEKDLSNTRRQLSERQTSPSPPPKQRPHAHASPGAEVRQGKREQNLTDKIRHHLIVEGIYLRMESLAVHFHPQHRKYLTRLWILASCPNYPFDYLDLYAHEMGDDTRARLESVAFPSETSTTIDGFYPVTWIKTDPYQLFISNFGVISRLVVFENHSNAEFHFRKVLHECFSPVEENKPRVSCTLWRSCFFKPHAEDSTLEEEEPSTTTTTTTLPPTKLRGEPNSGRKPKTYFFARHCNCHCVLGGVTGPGLGSWG